MFACTIRVCHKKVVRFLIYKHCRLSCSFRFSYLVLYFPYCIMINLNLVAANYSRGSNRLPNHCLWKAANLAWIFITFSFMKCLLPLLGLEFIAESRVLFTYLMETVTCFMYYFAIIFQTVRKILLNETKPMLQNLNQNTLTSPRKGINITWFFLLTWFISLCMWICVTLLCKMFPFSCIW